MIKRVVRAFAVFLLSLGLFANQKALLSIGPNYTRSEIRPNNFSDVMQQTRCECILRRG
jgi:hypothetical protein